MSEPDAAQPVLKDIDDLRNRQARRLLTHPATLIGGGILVGGAFAALAAAGSPAAGLAAALVALFAVLLAVWRVARRRAARDFFAAYAAARGLAVEGHADRLPAVTPLLRKGDRRYAEHVLGGRLPGGLEGSLGLYTYVETSGEGGDGDPHRFTVVTSELPQLAPFVDRLYCERRSGLRVLDSAEDVLRLRTQRVEVESEAVDRRYEIFAGNHEDPMRVRQLFEPTFLVWLGERAPEDFAFEVEAGALCCSVKGHRSTATALDELCVAAATVARRLLDEAAE